MFKFLKINIGLLSSALYVASQLIANVLSTKIALIPGLNLAVDGGTVIYPLTFTLRDFVHKTWGKKNARQLIIWAALLNLLMFGLFWLIAKLPSDPSWTFQQSYEQILLPVGRIVLASIVAQIVSELIDTEIFSKIYKKFNDLAAVFASNLVGLIVDSLIFSTIAFAGVLPTDVVMEIIWVNILVKLVISIVSMPFIKLVPRTVDFDEI